MARLWNSLRQAGRLLWQPSAADTVSSSLTPSATRHFNHLYPSTLSAPITQSRRTYSDRRDRRDQEYNPYQDFEAPSPFRRPKPLRHGYKPNFFTGGLLPRPKGKWEDMPIKGTEQMFPRTRDAWTQEKALFGQNDYIDILGDGKLHPWQLYKAPVWLKGFKGNEMQRLIRRLKFQGRQVKEMRPTQAHQMNKRLWYLYKKYNRRRSHASYWGGARRANASRFDKI